MESGSCVKTSKQYKNRHVVKTWLLRRLVLKMHGVFITQTTNATRSENLGRGGGVTLIWLTYEVWTGVQVSTAANQICGPVRTGRSTWLGNVHPVTFTGGIWLPTGMRAAFWNGLAPVPAPFTLNGTHQDYTGFDFTTSRCAIGHRPICKPQPCIKYTR